MDLEAAFEKELAAVDYEMAPPWDKSEGAVIKQSSGRSDGGESIYRAIWHDSGMSSID